MPFKTASIVHNDDLYHDPHPTKQLMGIYQDFHTKSYSDMFECPVCGLRRRYNLNYLGQRRVPMCDGKKITVSDRMEFHAWRALKDKAERYKAS